MTFDSYHDPTHLYFVTASICGWKNIFSIRSYAEIVLNSLVWLQENKRMGLYVYVLMPSHLHMILRPVDREIGKLIQNFGSYTAHAILNELSEDGITELLQFFHEQRRDPRHEHSIWQNIQAQNIFSSEFLNQKIEYIHNNPVAKDWNLVPDRAEYLYSSACFYDRGLQPHIPISDIREWL